MRKGLAIVVVGLLGCSPTGPSSADDKPPVAPSQPEADAQDEPELEATPDADEEDEAQPDPEEADEADELAIVVQMTAATLADDCGIPAAAPKAKRGRTSSGARARMARRCGKSSIQLSVAATQDAEAAKVTVKSVELLLESGTSLGMLEAQTPTVWSDNGYEAWDENVDPGEDLSVSYTLAQLDWSQVKDRANQTFTVKAVVSIGGSDQTVERDVTVHTPTSLPPNVRT